MNTAALHADRLNIIDWYRALAEEQEESGNYPEAARYYGLASVIATDDYTRKLMEHETSRCIRRAVMN